MSLEVHDGPVRVTYSIGGSRHTRWATAIHVTAEGVCGFIDVETGQKKFLSSTVDYAITEIESLPPDIRTAEDGEVAP